MIGNIRILLKLEAIMFDPICIPYGSKMLFNRFKLKPGVKIEDVELAMGEMCHVVKEKYGNNEGGFIAGQVFKFNGFISEEGSVSPNSDQHEHVAILTYWRSFEKHEASHADHLFKEKFSALLDYVENAEELGYDLLWQGEPG